MPRYEYMVFDPQSVKKAGPESISAALTELGLQGWRFVAVITEDVMGVSGARYAAPPALLFEREFIGCPKCRHKHAGGICSVYVDATDEVTKNTYAKPCGCVEVPPVRRVRADHR